ncbi:hypothetical protein ACIBG4_19205 [Nonomuraea sp. NPDC050383]|uniref:hypothetical protein n=1 Tax=Nonomuraea sp. NPDC050383 TaxID=3364362 RepID=UPI00379B85B4
MSGERLEEIVERLEIPHPFDIVEFTRQVARVRRRHIELRPVDTSADGPSGMWLATDTVDYICYEQRTSRSHQEHIILHELGHMVCEHVSAPIAPDTLLRILLPTLDPAMVRSVLGRTTYAEPEEHEAERFAMLVLRQVGRLPTVRRPPLSAEAAGIHDRIEAALAPRPRSS